LLCVGAETTLFGKKFTNEQVYALVLILLGSLVYGLNDLEGLNTGYVWMSVNTITYAINNLYTKAKVSEMEQTADGVAYIEQLLTLPLFLGLGTASGEFPDCVFSFARLSLAPMLLFIGLGLAGTLICMSYSNLYKTVTATSVVVASNINKVISILLAYLCFGKPLTLIQVGGLGICIAGGMCYSFASSAANKSAKVVVEEEHLDLSNEQ
jgi:drug/metabolite transporter (DMT)-like permease